MTIKLRTANKIIPVIAAAFFFYAASDSFAQNIPPGSQPGAEASRFQSESKKKEAALEKKAKTPEIKVEEEKPSQPAEKGPAFRLNGIKITGITVFTQEELKPLYQSYIDKEVTFDDVEKVVEAIKGEYKKKGFLIATAYIPEQDIKNGVVEIKVAEGKLGEVKVESNKYFKDSLIKNYIHVKKNEILNILKLQRDILRLNQNPDLEVKTVIEPGKESETSDIILKTAGSFPYHFGYGFDTQGTRLTGKGRNSFSIRTTNFTGHNDTVFANVQHSTFSTGEYVNYTLPVDTYGTKLGLTFSCFDMKLGGEFKQFDITGRTVTFTPYISKELALSEDFQSDLELGLDAKSIKRKTAGQITSDDQLRMPYLDLNMSKIDTFFGGGQTTFSPRIEFSTSNFLGASERDHPTSSRPGTGGFFFKYMQDVSRIQRMPFESMVSIRSHFESSSTILPSSEQLQLGGLNTVRGYPEGDYLADYGATLNIDWIFPCYLIPAKFKLPDQDVALRNQVLPVLFMDLGGGALRKPQPGELNNKFLMGLGGGLRMSFKYCSIRLEWAGAVGDKPSSGNGPSTFYLAFQAEI